MLRTERIARVRRGMEAMGLSQILVSQPESIYYLTELFVQPGERMLALLIDQRGETLFVNHMFALSDVAGDVNLCEFDDVDDPIRLLASKLQPGKIGIDKVWDSHFTIRLMEHRGDLLPVVGSKPVDEARMRKDASEIDAMRASSRLNDQVVGALRSSLQLGERESDVARRYTELAVNAGAENFSFTPLICFGRNCAEPHHSTDATRLRAGDAVILDVGLSLNRAMSDMTRTVFMGSATDEQKKVYDIVLAANMAAKAAVRPGVPLRDIDRAARKGTKPSDHAPVVVDHAPVVVDLDTAPDGDIGPMVPPPSNPARKGATARLPQAK